jgi:hypothetical protein
MGQNLTLVAQGGNPTFASLTVNSLIRNVVSQSILSTTASLDFSIANFFNVTLAANATTHIKPINTKPGQIVDVLITTATNSLVSFPSNIKQGTAYTPTTTAEAKDALIFKTFDASNVYITDFTKNLTTPFLIGDVALGGIIAYILQSGDPGYNASVQKGYVVTSADVSAGIQWGCNFSAISGADGTALGTGNQNTTDIINGCGQTGAARSARAVNDGGYTDWYLPSKDELNKLYLNRSILGIGTSIYWSSSEQLSYAAFAQDFSNGAAGGYGKDFTHRVRAIRTF